MDSTLYRDLGRRLEGLCSCGAVMRMVRRGVGRSLPFVVSAAPHTRSQRWLFAGRRSVATAAHERDLQLCRTTLGPS